MRAFAQSRLPNLLPICLTIACLAAPGAAQRTWIVDASGGGHFTDIQPAVDTAATSGDLIVVRPGTYNSVFIRGKGLRLVGTGNPRIVSRSPRGGVGISVSATTATQPVVVSGFGISVSNPLGTGIALGNCGGPVHLQGLGSGTLLATGVAQASLHEVNLSSVTLTGSNVSMTQSTITGGTLTLNQSRAALAYTSVSGVPVPFPFAPIQVNGGQLTLTGDASTRIAVPTNGGTVSAVQIASGIAYIDQAVTLVPKGAPPTSGTAIFRPIASVRASVGTNNTLTTRLRAVGALRGHTLLSLPTPRVALPTAVFGADLWIAPSHVVLDTGNMPSGGVRTTTTPLPSRPRGIQVTIQALIARSNALELSAPVSLTLD